MSDIKMKDLTVREFKKLIQDTIKETLEELLEGLDALKSQEYLNSIIEARTDYQKGRVVKLEDVLDV